VMQTSADAIYGARHVGLKAGLRIETPAVTVNRLCGSGIEAIAQAAQRLLLGEATMVLAGGMENMTQAPFVIRGARGGLKLGGGALEDSLFVGLTDSYCGLPMAMTAEKAGVRIAGGDTKVVEHGKADGMYITTTGIGRLMPGVEIAPQSVKAGDKVLLSGPIGDHGITILLARGELDLEAELFSDTRSVLPLVPKSRSNEPGKAACSSVEKMPPPSLLTTTRHRSGRGSSGPRARPEVGHKLCAVR